MRINILYEGHYRVLEEDFPELVCRIQQDDRKVRFEYARVIRGIESEESYDV